MKKTGQTARESSRRTPTGKSPKSDFSWLPAGVFLIGAGLLVWLIVNSFKVPEPGAAPETSSAISGNSATGAGPVSVAATAASGEIKPLPEAIRQKLPGNWQRTDADYVIEIKLVGADGVTDARYFNPFNQRSIHVEKAVVARKSGGPEFFMVLRDEGYPGSTYTLRYDEATDSLAGIYYQATMQQSFEVAFQRTQGN